MPPKIIVKPEFKLDDAISVSVIGLGPRADVELCAELVDDEGARWASAAHFVSDAQGAVDLAQSSPVSGTWDVADAGGLFWSMRPCDPEDFAAFRLKAAGQGADYSSHSMGLPSFQDDTPHRIRLRARAADGVEVQADVLRYHFPEGLRETAVREGRLRGVVLEPTSQNRRYPGVIMIPGSDGGIRRESAALLAARGFAVFALGYFNYADLPKYQVRVPLEYFAEALDWFRERLGHDRIGLHGSSRGGEGVLIIASTFPDRVKAVVANVPGDLYGGATSADGTLAPAWALAGEDLPWAGNPQDMALVPEALRASPTPSDKPMKSRELMEPFYLDQGVYRRSAIEVERMRCPVLFISGQDDQTWPSYEASQRAVARLESHGYSWPVEHLSVPAAGHMVKHPGWPTVMLDFALHPLLPMFFTLGGTAAATARLQRRGWDATLRFLSEHLG